MFDIYRSIPGHAVRRAAEAPRQAALRAAGAARVPFTSPGTVFFTGGPEHAGLLAATRAGGVFLARAADLVWIRAGAVLNPHYKDMGNLYGSEFWTYLLPKACGQENAERIAAARLPMGADEALDLGLADRILTGDTEAFEAQVKADAVDLAESPDFAASLEQKIAARDLDEAEKPLEAYRAEELERMRKNFYGFDPSYHVARYNFVHKVPKSRTPLTLARHRASPPPPQARRRAAS